MGTVVIVFINVRSCFCSLYNNLETLENLRVGRTSYPTYHMFRDDIRPEWEDNENTNGGEWVIISPIRHSSKMWEVLLLSCIGETLTDCDYEICGVVLRVRKKISKISVWTKNSSATTTKQMG